MGKILHQFVHEVTQIWTILLVEILIATALYFSLNLSGVPREASVLITSGFAVILVFIGMAIVYNFAPKFKNFLKGENIKRSSNKSYLEVDEGNRNDHPVNSVEELLKDQENQQQIVQLLTQLLISQQETIEQLRQKGEAKESNEKTKSTVFAYSPRISESDIIVNFFAQELKNALEEKGLTLWAIASRTDVPREVVHRLQKGLVPPGNFTMLNADDLEKVIRAFQLDKDPNRVLRLRAAIIANSVMSGLIRRVNLELAYVTSEQIFKHAVQAMQNGEIIRDIR